MCKPRLAVFKFASCDGCQLSLLDAEDHLLAVADAVEIVYFPEATSHMEEGPYDIALVEGSITTPHDAERIQQIRKDARYLMTIGACATAGGIQALRNWADKDEFMQAVYATPDYIQVLETSTPIAEHVQVDFELRGCPINQYQLIEVIRSLLAGQTPRTPRHSVCLDCKRRGTVCVTVAQGTACLGPVTQSGCHALCPSYNRGCYGCFGPALQANLVSLSAQMEREGASKAEIAHKLKNFNAYAPAFRTESTRLVQLEGDQRG
ncbi:oxidoreductase [Gimesia sp.]|uniref:NADH-quinone oxidoreductase subunit B family protein n=1 Tax=Gimesia sp. TaxID=2024833 RepID=UPI0032EF13C4